MRPMILLILMLSTSVFAQRTQTIGADCLRIQDGTCVDKNELGYLDGVTSGIQGQLDAVTTGFNQVDNTSDLDKPVSTATQTALDLKANDADVVHDTGNESISGEKTFTGKIVSSSTTNGAHPCPTMTDAEMLAIASPVDGDCVNNSTLNTWLVYDGVEAAWEEVGSGGGLSAWLTATDYEIGAVVIESNKIYKALTTHTSGTFATDLAAAKWIRLNDEFNVEADFGFNYPVRKLVTPNKQVTQTASDEVRLENGNKQILENPSFEHQTASTGWTNTLGTVILHTSDSIDGTRHVELSLSAESLEFYQDSTINASAFADGVQGLGYIYVKTAVANIYVCPRNAGTRAAINNCVAVSSNNKWGLYKVPFILGATSNGIGVYSLDTSGSAVAVTGSVKVDDGYIGAQDLKQDATTVQNQFIYANKASTGSASAMADVAGFTVSMNSGASLLSVNTSTGVFTAIENVEVIAEISGGSSTAAYLYISDSNTSSSRSQVIDAGTESSISRPIRLEKGQTFKFSTYGVVNSQVFIRVSATQFHNTQTYSSTNADASVIAKNTSTQALTASVTDISATTEEKDGLNLWDGDSFTAPESGEYTGFLSLSTTTATGASFYSYINGSIGAVLFGSSDTLSKTAPFSVVLSQGQSLSFRSNAGLTVSGVRVYIRKNSNLIIGTFRDVVTSIGSTNGNGKVADIQKVKFGSGANCESVCSTGTCTICNLVGSKITSVTWQGTGIYRLNGLDGTKYDCHGNGVGSAYVAGISASSASTSTYVYMDFGTTAGVNVGRSIVTCAGVP